MILYMYIAPDRFSCNKAQMKSKSGNSSKHKACGEQGQQLCPRKVATFERLHDKTNKMTCAPSEDSDPPGHPPSLIRVFCCVPNPWVAKDQSFLHADNEDSDQTGRIPRLIWVFTSPTSHFVGFVVCHLRTTKAQMDLCICAIWSAPMLFAA